MTQSSASKYNQLIIDADSLGCRMKILAKKATPAMSEPPYVDEYFEGFAASAEILFSIGMVLGILREAPNAYINPEALEALSTPVEFAAKIVSRKWAQDLLKADSLVAS